MIPLIDLKAVQAPIQEDLDRAIAGVVARAWYVLGDEVASFEDEFARYCGARHCVGVGNGLDAISLLLMASGIGPGDEVIVPSHTYVATWLGVTRVGATVVPVEPDLRTYNIDPSLVRRAITPRTKAVVAVHLYGQPADMHALAELCRDEGLLLFEDAAQAHGAQAGGRRVGSLGDGAAFSFYPTKNLGALGDGGAVVVDDAATAETVRLLRNYGSSQKYVHELQGVNSRLDEIQAAVLRVKLRHLDSMNRRRVAIAERYASALAGMPGLAVPAVPEWAEPVWHVYVVRHPERDELAERLTTSGVGTLVYYPVPPHLSGAYAGQVTGALPTAEVIATTNLALPMHPALTEADQQRVTEAVGTACAGFN
ncbi:MAG: DegT/DnrJ/EryC1/StrS family aminotransferase [Ilumatobacter sp.]|nr:DegT/DnrJ/EryC1/StrS family aminotransferase [Ilumatobacter sp.]